MKDLETIFRERRIACDGVVICPVYDWNTIVAQVSNLETINKEMYELLEDLSMSKEYYSKDSIDKLLAKARGETK